MSRTLYVHRGGVFHALAWPLTDQAGNWLREDDLPSLEPVAKARPWRASASVAVLDTSMILLAMPGEDEPVAAAQIDQMSPTRTTAFPYATGVWDLLVNGELIDDGPIVAGLLVSRP